MLQICENIRLAREASGKSQVEMAKLLKVPRTTYSNWEKETEPSVTILKSIAEILGVKLGDILNIDITPNKIEDTAIGTQAAIKFLIAEIKELKAKVYGVSQSKISLEVDRDLLQLTKHLMDEMKAKR